MRFDPLLKRPRSATWVPPAHRFLAFLHGGPVFTTTLPVLGMIALGLIAYVFVVWWLGSWAEIFVMYERWDLIVASVVHVAVLMVGYAFVHVAWVRLQHLRRVPPDESAALRSLPILCRAVAELYFLFSIGLSLRIFAMPAESWPPAGWSSTFTVPFVGSTVGADIGWGLGMTAFVALGSILGIVVFYSLANLIETYQSIELNSRKIAELESSPHDLVRSVGR